MNAESENALTINVAMKREKTGIDNMYQYCKGQILLQYSGADPESGFQKSFPWEHVLQTH